MLASILGHCLIVILVLVLLAVCAATGDAVLRRFRMLPGGDEGPFVSLAAGLGIVGTVLMVLGFVGGLRPLPLAALFLLFAVLGRRGLASFPGRLRKLAGGFVDAVRAEPVPGAVACLVLALTTLFLVSFAVAPPVESDALMYHLRLPATFLATGGIHLPPDSVDAAHIGPLHLLYVPLMMVGGASAPALLSACVALAVAGLIFVLSRRLFGDRTALLATALFWGTTTVLMVASTARVGVSVLLFTLAAHATLLGIEEDGADTRRILLAGILVGLSAAVKVTGLVYAVALTPLLLVSRKSLAAIAKAAWIFGIGVVAAYLPWILKNVALVGAPLTPYFGVRPLPAWIARLYAREGARPPAAGGPPSFLNPVFSFRDLFLHPQHLAVEEDGAYYFTCPALVLVPAAAIFWKRRNVLGLLLPGALYLVLVVLAHGGHVDLRYLLPAIPPLTILVAFTIVAGLDRIFGGASGGSRSLATGLAVAVTLLSLLPTGTTALGWLRNTRALGYLLGRTSEREYVDTHLLATVRAYGHMREALRHEVGEHGGTVLMLFEFRGYGLGPPVLEDRGLDNWRLLAPLVPADGCLRDPGFSYLLLNTGTLDWFRSRSPGGSKWNLEDFVPYSRRCLEPVWAGFRYVLFRRKAADSASRDRESEAHTAATGFR